MTGKQLQKAIFGGLGVLLGFVWLGCFAVIFLGGNTGFVQGIPGFAQEAAWRVAVAAALAAAVFSGGRVLLGGEYAWEMKAAFLAAGAICILLAFFLLREPVMIFLIWTAPEKRDWNRSALEAASWETGPSDIIWKAGERKVTICFSAWAGKNMTRDAD